MADDLVHVKGLSELSKFLDELTPKLQKNVMRGSLRSGIKVIQTEAKATAAFADKTGLLRKGLKISTNSKGGVVTASLKATGKHAFLAGWVEFGTAAHIIKAKDGGALSFGGGVVQSVEHPGVRAHAFMRPALDARASDAVVAAAEYMKERISTKEGLDTSGVTIEGDE